MVNMSPAVYTNAVLSIIVLVVSGTLIAKNSNRAVTYICVKTSLIIQDRKFVIFFTQTQSFMNALSNFTISVDQSKVVCFC